MIIKSRKGLSLILLGMVFILVLSFYSVRPDYFVSIKPELASYWMTMDPGFSDARKPRLFLAKLGGNIGKVIEGKLIGFENRPALERIDIDVKFKDFQTILKDRARAIENSILTNPTRVPAKIRFNNKSLKAKIRLKGDLAEHWNSQTRMSLRVTLKGNNAILGFKSLEMDPNFRTAL